MSGKTLAGSGKQTLIQLILGATILLCLLVVGKDLLESGETGTFSIRQIQFLQNYKPDPNSPITLIGTDSKTNQQYNRLFGRHKSRSFHAYAFRFFRRAKPKAVIFDGSFNGGVNRMDPAGDAMLVESLQGDTRFISALVFSTTKTKSSEIRWDAQPEPVRNALLKNSVTVEGQEHGPELFQNGFSSLVPPINDLLEKTPMQFCTANAINPDRQGVIRRWVPFAHYEGHFFPHLGLCPFTSPSQLFSLSREGLLTWGKHRLNVGTQGFPYIKWYGHQAKRKTERVFREYSYWDVLISELFIECRENPALPICGQVELPESPPFQPEDFEGQYVLIGDTEPNTGDSHQTVIAAQYPGVYIVANIIANILNDDFVQPVPLWANALATLCLLGLGAWVFIRMPSATLSLIAIVSLILIYYGVTYYAYAHYNRWLNFLAPISIFLSLYVGAYIYRYQQAEQKRQQLRSAFGKYVSPAVMVNLEKNPDAMQLGGQRRELTLLFCDIRGFTTFSEENEPEVVEQLLNQYFTVMNNIIKNTYQGSINKLMGDAIMAYWGFPLEKQNHAFLAVSAAMAMRDALIEWRKDPEKPPLNIGIGLNTGEVMIGNIGSDDFMDFTVIGDAVNLASRLEGLNKEYGSTIIISQSTYEKVKDRIEARYLGSAKVKGKEQAIEVYEPLSFKETST